MTRLLCLVVILLAAAPVAADDETPMRVVVAKSGLEPSCVDLEQVAAAIARQPGFSAQVAAMPQTHAGAAELFLEGPPEHLELTLRAGQREQTRLLENTPCGSIPDVVAAFVTAGLVPFPTIVSGPAWSADELTSAVRGRLGGALRPELKLVLSETAGTWEATLTSPSCSQQASIGRLPEERDVAAHRAADVVVSMIGERGGCARLVAGVHSERALLLSEALRSYTPRVRRIGAAVLGGTAVLVGGVSLAVETSPLGRTLTLAGTTTALAGSIAMIAAPESAAASTLGAAGYVLGMGTFMVGVSFPGSPSSSEAAPDADLFHATYGVIGGAWIATAVWVGIDYFAERQVEPGTLFEARARLRSPRLRARISEEELARYEQAFRRTGIRKRYLVPPLVASLGIVIYAARLEESDNRDFVLFLGGSQLAMIGLGFLIPDPVSKYTHRLREAGLNMQITPMHAGAGLAVSGRF